MYVQDYHTLYVKQYTLHFILLSLKNRENFGNNGEERGERSFPLGKKFFPPDKKA